MNRRGFLKGIAGGAAALLLPPEPERRVFQLDRTMISTSHQGFVRAWNDMSTDMDKRFTHVELDARLPQDQVYVRNVVNFGKALEDTRTPFMDHLVRETTRIKKIEEARIIYGLTVLDDEVRDGTMAFDFRENRSYVYNRGTWVAVR